MGVGDPARPGALSPRHAGRPRPRTLPQSQKSGVVGAAGGGSARHPLRAPRELGKSGAAERESQLAGAGTVSPRTVASGIRACVVSEVLANSGAAQELMRAAPLAAQRRLLPGSQG